MLVDAGHNAVDLGAPKDAPSASWRKMLFLWCLVAVTISPMVLMIFFWPFRNEQVAVSSTLQTIAILSTAHVALTGFFYFDRDYQKHIRQNWPYHVLLPLGVIALCGAATAIWSATGRIYVMIIYHAWLLYHYGRQNYGVLSFSISATHGAKPLLSEKIALHLVPVGGILGAHAVVRDFSKSTFAPYVDLSVLAGQIITVAGLATAAFALLRHRMMGESTWRSAFLLLSAVFFLPTFFYTNYAQAIFSYAYAHALQYYIFMYCLASGTKSAPPWRAMATLTVVTTLGWWLLVNARTPDIWGPLAPAMPGIALGLVMWHFIMDADLWRLSKTWQRSEVRERLSFIFK